MRSSMQVTGKPAKARCGQSSDVPTSARLPEAVHCATHGPDSPQLWAQEKLLELQLEMHSENVWFCANRNLSINVAALPDVIPDIISKTTATYLMA